MKRCTVKLFLLAVYVIGATSIASENCDGIWADAGLQPKQYEAKVSLASDKIELKPVVVAKDHLLHLSNNGTLLLPLYIPNTPGLTEVLWSGDGKRVAVNWSDGGVVGSWNSSIVVVNDVSKPVIQDLPADIVAKANKLPQCEEAESANLGVVAWPKNGQQQLLVAEVPPHSSCRNMGSIQGYLLDSDTGKLVAMFSEAQLKADWRAYLGCRFQG